MVRATALVTDSDVTTAGFYSLAVHASAWDGSSINPIFFTGQVQVPYGLNFKKSDSVIRQQLSDYFAGVGVVVDPDDIYFPMTS